jgi:uncharacterized protein with ParB-like and HNH nuclease domain
VAGGIDFELSGIGSQLKRRLLAVPVYQRPYSWSSEHVAEFWDDVIEACSSGDAEYFLGTIVLTRRGSGDRDTIIDGQQRLATTVLLLAAVRDTYAERGDGGRASIIHDTAITTSDLRSGEKVARLRLGSEDDSYFRKLVVEKATDSSRGRRSHELIFDASPITRAATVMNGANDFLRLSNSSKKDCVPFS